jgi:hypothetical protein
MTRHAVFWDVTSGSFVRRYRSFGEKTSSPFYGQENENDKSHKIKADRHSELDKNVQVIWARYMQTEEQRSN